jgi:pyruvate,orthophosphate dikinase
VRHDVELDAGDLRALVAAFKRVYAAHGKPLPPDEPYAQLEAAIAAVFRSWMTPRAVKYRQINRLEGKLFGTAVTVQRMVYGNVNDRSASGVAFSRDPATGERRPYGEFLRNAQGEDVVSGAPARRCRRRRRCCAPRRPDPPSQHSRASLQHVSHSQASLEHLSRRRRR